MELIIEFIKEWGNVIASITGFTVLGLILKITNVLNTLHKSKEDFYKEQLSATEKWSEREKTKLVEEIDKLKMRLDEANVDLNSSNIQNLFQNVEKKLTDEIKDIVKSIEGISIPETQSTKYDYEFNLLLAKGYSADNNWEKAAYHYDLASVSEPNNWELHLFRGVAHANSRKGHSSNLRALNGYSSAIVYLPSDIKKNLKARIFIYKGAMLKRLHRLEEAKFYVSLGLEYAEDTYEKADGLYNLASIYAMLNFDEKFYQTAANLRSFNLGYFNILIKKMDTYFPQYKNDKNLKSIISGESVVSDETSTNNILLHDKSDIQTCLFNIKRKTSFLWDGLEEVSKRKIDEVKEEIRKSVYLNVKQDLIFLQNEGHFIFETSFKRDSEQFIGDQILEIRLINISRQLKNFIALHK